jgi:hypothetical protein
VGKSCRNDGLQTKKATGEKTRETKRQRQRKKASDKPTGEKTAANKKRQTNRPGEKSAGKNRRGENRRFGNGHKKRKHGIGLLSGFQSFLTNLKLLT